MTLNPRPLNLLTKTYHWKKTMNTCLKCLVITLNLAFCTVGYASDDHKYHSMPTSENHSHTMTHKGSMNMESIEGVIKRIDKGNNKVTIKHGEIKSHDMPAMTMVFNLSSPNLLQNLNKGDEVKFKLDTDMKTIVHIEKK